MAEMGRAAVFVGARKPFELRGYPLPDPGDHDILVQVVRANVCGSDLHIWRGETGFEELGLRYGMILGHEMLGRVVKRGKEVHVDTLGQVLRDGDRVVVTYYIPCDHCRSCLRGAPHACMRSLMTVVRPCDEPPHFVGAFASHYLVSSRQSVFKVPDSVPDDAAAGANCALSQVIHGFDEAHLGFGEHVVVQGAGGLGLFACAVARERGADKVIAVDSVPARLALALQFGADAVIDIRQVPDARDRVRQILSLTDGGADVVVEVVGSPDVVPEGIRMLARGGRYLEIGNISPKRTFKLDPSLLVGFNRSIVGVSLYPSLALRRAVDFLARARTRFAFDKLVSHQYRLDDIDRAFEESDVFAGPDKPVTRAAIVADGAL